MATYKLIQDIEAEDKILGPLTLRQFIFAMIAVFLFYLCFLVTVKHVVFLLIIFLPPALFFGFFALPFGRDQPTEIWFLAKLRFWFKPRRRVWNQSGLKELVEINVPKKLVHNYTNGLSQPEVESRLKILAQTIDSRGWAVKHAVNNTFQPPVIVGGGSDRLIDIGSMPQEVPADNSVVYNDVMDPGTSPIARQFDSMIDESEKTRREQLVEQMDGAVRLPQRLQQAASGPSAPSSNWFMPTPGPTQGGGYTATPLPAAEVDSAAEATLAAGLSHQANTHRAFGNLRTLQPLSTRKASTVSTNNGSVTDDNSSPSASAVDQTTPMTAQRDPAIMYLATNNDLNLSTIAREANKNKSSAEASSNEVVIPLH
ncbi:MAG TPA: PrgI family protein [Candidatus Saccharimonadales bacterium]|nr:PrgI family protein [Candidatus Saccharimonadales bacterium]